MKKIILTIIALIGASSIYSMERSPEAELFAECLEQYLDGTCNWDLIKDLYNNLPDGEKLVFKDKLDLLNLDFGDQVAEKKRLLFKREEHQSQEYENFMNEYYSFSDYVENTTQEISKLADVSEWKKQFTSKMKNLLSLIDKITNEEENALATQLFQALFSKKGRQTMLADTADKVLAEHHKEKAGSAEEKLSGILKEQEKLYTDISGLNQNILVTSTAAEDLERQNSDLKAQVESLSAVYADLDRQLNLSQGLMATGKSDIDLDKQNRELTEIKRNLLKEIEELENRIKQLTIKKSKK